MDIERYYSKQEIASLINIKHTEHSKARAQQRAISIDLMKLAMLYSVAIFKQGLIYHVVKNSNLPNTIDNMQKNELKNIVVVISGKTGEVITCYRNKNAMHHIKKKTKRLAKRRLVA